MHDKDIWIQWLEETIVNISARVADVIEMPQTKALSTDAVAKLTQVHLGLEELYVQLLQQPTQCDE